MNTDQVQSVVRSVLKFIGGLMVAHGMTKAASTINAEDTFGLVMTIIGFVWSHFVHKGDSPSTSTGAKASLWLLLLLFVASFGHGCASSSQLAPGGAYGAMQVVTTNAVGGLVTNSVPADIALFTADSSFDLAYSAVDAVLLTERNNRAFLWSISPSIKHSLDAIRPQAWSAVKAYAAARQAYIANPTTNGILSVQGALGVMQALSQSAQAAIAPATNAVPNQ